MGFGLGGHVGACRVGFGERGAFGIEVKVGIVVSMGA